MLLSIIIPVYNASDYVCDALDSITKQNFNDMEIIIINDGSTDSSKLIIEEYISKHKDFNIRYIEQQNSGVSSARINGIHCAKGDYIAFVDADDALVTNYFKIIQEVLKKYNFPDCVNYWYSRVRDRNFDTCVDTDLSNDEFIKDKNEIALRFFAKSTNNSVCNKIFKRSIIQNLDFSECLFIKDGEDRLMNMIIFEHLNGVVFTNQKLYLYYCDFYFTKHKNLELKYSNSEKDNLLNKVISNIDDKVVINEIRNHEIDKLISYIRSIISFGNVSFSSYKRYLREVKSSIFYKEFLKQGYSKHFKAERLFKNIFFSIKFNFKLASFIKFKLLAKRLKKANLKK